MNNNDQRLWSFPEITVDLLGPERPTAQLSTSHGPTFHRNTFVHQLETGTMLVRMKVRPQPTAHLWRFSSCQRGIGAENCPGRCWNQILQTNNWINEEKTHWPLVARRFSEERCLQVKVRWRRCFHGSSSCGWRRRRWRRWLSLLLVSSLRNSFSQSVHAHVHAQGLQSFQRESFMFKRHSFKAERWMWSSADGGGNRAAPPWGFCTGNTAAS